MAYQADILINVRGFQDLARIQKQLEGTAQKIDQVNKAAASFGAPVRNIERFTAQLNLAEKALQKVAIGSPQEQRAISNYVTALNNSNVARDRQNKLIENEINVRNAATNAIRANVNANIAESQATRAARDEAKALNTELIQQERLRRKLAERGLMQLQSGKVARGVSDAGFGVQGPARPPKRQPSPLEAPGVLDAILGGGFPLLFGGGPGAIAGGAAGGFIGGKLGGLGGLALGIGLSAIGQQIDDAVIRVQELGNALNAIDVERVRASFVAVNAELETSVRRSLEAGQAEQARAAIATQVAAQTGALFGGVERSAEATNRLNGQWTAVTGSVSALVSLVSSNLVNGLTTVIGVLNLAVQGLNVLVSSAQAFNDKFSGAVAVLDPFGTAFNLLAKLFPNINEQQEKLKAGLIEATDAADRQLRTAVQLEQIDKQRTTAVTTLGKLINIEADRQAKVTTIRSQAEEKIIALRKQYGSLTDAQSKQELNLAVQQVQAQAAIETREANRAALRQRLVALNEQLVAQDKLAQQLLANQAAVEAARVQAKQQVLQSEIAGLELRKQFALSLNQESALIDQIAVKKKAAADSALEQARQGLDLAVQQAAAELQSTERQFQRGFASAEQLRLAQSNLQTAIATRNELSKGAVAQRDQAVFSAEVERRQQQVAAFAAESARQSEAFSRSSQIATAALDNQLRVSSAVAQTALTINNLELQSLQTKLNQATSDSERASIIEKIRDLEISNAQLTLQATRAQIAAEVERQRIAAQNALVAFKNLEAVVNTARAQGPLNQAYLVALESQRAAAIIAQGNFQTSVQVANAQNAAADATFRAAVNAANFKAQLEGSARAAASTAASLNQAAAAAGGAAGGGNVSGLTNISFGRAGQNPVFAAALAKALNEFNEKARKELSVSAAQREYNRIISSFLGKAEQINKAIAEREKEQAQQELDDLLSYQNTARSINGFADAVGDAEQSIRQRLRDFMDASAGPNSTNQQNTGGGSSFTPQVNITTGPVMQMGNETFVTQGQLASATQQAAQQGANLALQNLQNSPSLRRNAGLAR